MFTVTRTNIRLKADPHKVIVKFLDFGDPARILPVVQYVAGLSEKEAGKDLQEILNDFEHRHFELEKTFLANFSRLKGATPDGLSATRQKLIGAYFTHEYSIEASALFNPSIVPHPDQNGLDEGALRFILSLRAVGEGHISSIAFQTGVISADGNISLDDRAGKLSTGRKEVPESETGQVDTDAIYDLTFAEDIPVGGRVLFPGSSAESNGMEDARFVKFSEAGSDCYFGTYTAYNGRTIHPHFIETTDFQHFKIRPFAGNAASNKGMAFFPEKINRQYAMIGRQDGRNLTILYSDDVQTWDDFELLQIPRRGWEILQMGNCGSPVKTSKGWLLLTHAVGAMRKYVLSFTLLDLHRPEQVLASLDQPFMQPNEEEREGYVPNVLYTCGLLEHNGRLIIPYAMSDSSISFAVAETEKVLEALVH